MGSERVAVVGKLIFISNPTQLSLVGAVTISEFNAEKHQKCPEKEQEVDKIVTGLFKDCKSAVISLLNASPPLLPNYWL